MYTPVKEENETEIKEYLYQPIRSKSFSFAISAREEGVLSGVNRLKALLPELGLTADYLAQEGQSLSLGTKVLSARGGAEAVSRAEELLLGLIGKPSGVASAAAALNKLAGRIKVVCGAWKKVDPAVRGDLRQAILAGGAGMRISDQPFVYLDKNYMRMFGGISPAVSWAKSYDPERLVSAQLRGEFEPIELEAAAAVTSGADILMVDTGCLEDLKKVSAIAASSGWRHKVQLAFSGGVTSGNLASAEELGADIVDVGRAIIDAPMLDFSLDVEGE